MGFDEVNADDVKKNISILREMQKPIDYIVHVEPGPIPFSKRIPFLARFAKDAGEAGHAVLQISTSVNAFHQTTTSLAAASGLQFGGVALAALDFILIPVIYLASYILNKDVPITLNNNARWLFSAILLGLTLTALFAPVTAPIIALVTAGISFVLSSFLLGRVVYERYQLAKERKAIETILAEAEEDMKALLLEAQSLENELSQTTDATELAAIDSKIAPLQDRYKSQKELITDFKKQKFEVDEKIKAVGFRHILDKSIGIIFSALAVSGLVVTLFFPPVGLAILAAVSIATLTYIGVRIAVPLIGSLVKFIQSKLQKTSEAEVIANDHEHSHDVKEGLEEGSSYDFMAHSLLGHKDEDKPTPTAATDDLAQSRIRTDSIASVDSFHSAYSIPEDASFYDDPLNDADDEEQLHRERSDSEASFYSALLPSFEKDDVTSSLDTPSVGERLKDIKSTKTASAETEDKAFGKS